MSEIQKNTSKKFKNIFLLFFSLTIIYLIITSLVNNRFQAIELHTRAQIAEQQTLLATIAEITARNGADSVTEAIVRDCTIKERSVFDDKLGRLDDGLPRTELVELERLFGRCGSFYSERKSVMVARLSREIEIYRDYVDQLSVILGEDMSDDFFVAKWEVLATEESKQSEYFSKLVKLQDEIITALLAGRVASSPEIVEILREVREVQETLLVANKQASNIRSELIAL